MGRSNLEVIVRDDKGAAIEKADVKLEKYVWGGPPRSGKTDAGGLASFNQISDGVYSVYATWRNITRDTLVWLHGDSKRVEVSLPRIRHVLLGFEGFNAPYELDAGWPIDPDAKDNRVMDILRKSAGCLDKPHETVEWLGLHTDWADDVKLFARWFVKNKLSRDDDGKQLGKVIVYGYSMGGDTAVEITQDMDSVQFDLLVTVDAATGNNLGIDREIPANVKINENYYTPNPQTNLGQSGGPNTAQNPGETTVHNTSMPGESHASISKATKQIAIDHIKKALCGP